MCNKQQPTHPGRQGDDAACVLDSPYLLEPDEGRRMFDEAVREAMGVSGEEFIRR